MSYARGRTLLSPGNRNALRGGPDRQPVSANVVALAWIAAHGKQWTPLGHVFGRDSPAADHAKLQAVSAGLAFQ